ncbi:MAG: hypothetical protein AAGI14_06715 [Pseudomonadota bacterium]
MDKKTERLEVRLSHADKQSFQNACEEGGETPSDVVRRFIRRYIRRADSDRVGEGLAALRSMAGRNRGRLAVGAVSIFSVALVVVAVSGVGSETSKAVATSAPAMTKEAAFERFDVNRDGVLKISEFDYENHLLFKIMDVDGTGFITFGEFKSHGEIGYTEVTLERFAPPVIHPDKEGCLAEVTPDQALQLVRFDLRYPEIQISTEEKSQSYFTDYPSGLSHLIIWERNSRKPCFLWLINEANVIRFGPFPPN